MERLKQELQVLNRLINDKQQPAEALIRLWLWNRDPNFTAAEVEEHVQLVKRELKQLRSPARQRFSVMGRLQLRK